MVGFVTQADMDEVITLLKSGKIGVMPTDTLYGLVGSALNPEVVEKIYNLRKRVKDKPMIILISEIDDLEKFEINLTKKQYEFLEKIWPNPASVVLPCPSEKLSYLHRGKESLAFRVPKDKNLLKVLTQTGPLVAPSANIEGEKPAENIEEARKYFGDSLSFYIDAGEIKSQPSTLISLDDKGVYLVLRQGVFKI